MIYTKTEAFILYCREHGLKSVQPVDIQKLSTLFHEDLLDESISTGDIFALTLSYRRFIIDLRNHKD